MNKYSLGDIVYSKRYEISNAVVVGIEMVSSNPTGRTQYTLDQYIQKCDTYQYTIVFYDKEAKDTLKETLYECHLED